MTGSKPVKPFWLFLFRFLVITLVVAGVGFMITGKESDGWLLSGAAVGLVVSGVWFSLRR